MINMVKFDKKLALGLAVLCSVINFLCNSLFCCEATRKK